jgi:hypothetical protein
MFDQTTSKFSDTWGVVNETRHFPVEHIWSEIMHECLESIKIGSIESILSRIVFVLELSKVT